MNFNRVVQFFLFVLLVIWIGISFARTAFNISKLATEERQWYGLTDDQKRALEFGDLHYFLRFAQSHTTYSGTVLFITDNDEAYYLSRYYLYPTLVIRPGQPGLWDPHFTAYTQMLVYPANHSQLIKTAEFYLLKEGYNHKIIYHGTKGEIGIVYSK